MKLLRVNNLYLTLGIFSNFNDRRQAVRNHGKVSVETWWKQWRGTLNGVKALIDKIAGIMFILGGALTNREVLAVICTPMHFNLTCSLSCEHVLYMFYKLIVIAIDLCDCSARNGGDRWKSG